MTMKFDALARLQHLGGIRDAKRAAYVNVEDDRQNLRDRLNAARRERGNIARGFHPHDAAQRLDDLDTKIAHLEKQMSELEQRRETAGSEHRAASGAFARAREYAISCGMPVPDGEGAETWMDRSADPVATGIVEVS